MPWNPNKYNEFKNERLKPFFDLTDHIEDKPNLSVIDLGCGTGELTYILSEKLTNPIIVGIDNSVEMLAKAPKNKTNVTFTEKTIESALEESTKYDLIFANASLQWVENHQSLFPKMINHLNSNGQLAVQIPSQSENLLNKILYALVQEKPFSTFLNGWKRTSPVLSMDEYTTLLFNNHAKNITIYQKVYPIITNTSDKLYDFIAGSSMVPYLERLTETTGLLLENEFKRRIFNHFNSYPSVYAFKRLIIYARF